MTKVGLVGCGAVGSRLAGRLLRNKIKVKVHDRDREHAKPTLEAGAEWAASGADAARDSDLIVSALPRPQDVESLFLGPDSPWLAARRDATHVETSTVGHECTRRLASGAASRHIRFLDAPISKSAYDEDDLRLVMWVGGHADHFDVARPTLEILADRVVYCGGIGNGQVTKLVNNLIAHTLTVAVGEALALGVKAGTRLDLLSTALQHGTAQNRMLDELLPESVFRGNWRPGLRLELAIKDLKLAAELAEQHDVRLTFIDRLQELFLEASDRGWSDESAHTVVRLLEESSGVRLRSAGHEDA